MPPAYLQGPAKDQLGTKKHCQGKVSYDTAIRAHQVLDFQLARRLKARITGPLSVFRCLSCGVWHLGRIDKQDVGRQTKKRLHLVRHEKGHH